MEKWFIVLENKVKKRFLVFQTSFINEFESVMCKQDKTKFALHVFGLSYREKLARIAFIDYLKKNQKYKFSLWVLMDFFKL